VFLRGRILALLGFILTLVSLIILIERDLGLVSANAYTIGALLFAIGLVLFAIDSLRSGTFARWIPIGWILSTIVGPVGYFAPGLQILFTVSGLIFGIAFAGAGIQMWRLTPRLARQDHHSGQDH